MKCSTSDCMRASITDFYSSSREKKKVSRCLLCVSPESRRKVDFYRHEHKILNELIIRGKLKEDEDIEEITHDQTIEGSSGRPDLLIKTNKKWIDVEIDENQHKNPKQIEIDKQRKIRYAAQAKEEGLIFQEIRLWVGEKGKNPVVGKSNSGKVKILDEKRYDRNIDHFVKNLLEAKNTPSKVETVARVDMLAEKIAEMNITCSQIMKSGKKCIAPSKKSGMCGRHCK